MDDEKPGYAKYYIGISYSTGADNKTGRVVKELPLTEVVAKVVVNDKDVAAIDGAVFSTATMGIAVAAASAAALF